MMYYRWQTRKVIPQNSEVFATFGNGCHVHPIKQAP